MTTDAAPAGYLSDADKRRFTTWVGLLGAATFILQFMVPFVMMMAMMPMMFFGAAFRQIDAGGAVVWRDRLWLLERDLGLPRAGSSPTKLKSIALTAGAEPHDELEVPVHEAALVAGEDALWFVGEEEVARWDGTELERTPIDEVLGDTSPPFFLRGELAVVQSLPSRYVLRLFRDGAWASEPLDALGLDGAEHHCCDLRLLDAGGVVHAFYSRQNTIYHRVLGGEGEWSVAARGGWPWQVRLVDGAPVVFTLGRHDDFDADLRASRLDADGWHREAEIDVGGSFAFGVAPLGGGDGVAVVTSTFPGSAVVRLVADGETRERWSFGDAFPFPSTMMGMMAAPYAAMLVLPLLLALAVTSLMRKHRISRHVVGEQSAEMATVWRRALAQLVDMVVVAGLPLAALSITWLAHFADPEEMADPRFVWLWFAWMFGWIGFLILAALVFAWLEGRWGVTPGKWLLGIRVLGTDLRPCGFGRAIIRNLLKAVDGMFNFLVGILMVALTEDWQRLGDLAARTVVVRAGRSGAVPPTTG